MGTLVVGALYTLLQNIANGIVWVMGIVLANISQYSLTVAQQPWVQQAVQVSVTVAASLFALKVAWEAASRYLLWNEGTADSDGGQFIKGILRVAIYGAGGTWLVYTVFQFGIWYGAALMAAPLSQAVTTAQNVLPHLLALPGMVMEDLFMLVLGFVILLVCIVIVGFQMAIRGAELIFFAVAAPLVSLSQLSADAPVWNSWWRSLVVLSLSQAVQWLGIKATVAAMQVITTTGSPAVNAAINVAAPGTLAVFGLFLSIGAAISTFRGPHLLREWSYRTGVGAGLYQGAVFAGQTVGRQMIANWMRR